MSLDHNKISKLDHVILHLIKENATIKELKGKTGLTANQLLETFNHLRNKGYLIEQEYQDNKEIITLKKQLDLEEKVIKSIYVEKDSIHIIAYSDTHIGSPYENIGAIDQLYNYGIEKGIHNFIHLGDLVQGIYKEKGNPALHEDIYSQAKYLVRKYPYDKNIIHYILLGNHDYHSIKKEGFDISKYIFSNRTDFINMGYFYAFLKFQNDYIMLTHTRKYPQDHDKQNIFEKYEKQNIIPKIVLQGHYHTSKREVEDNHLLYLIPSLYNPRENPLQGAWDIRLNFNSKGYIEEAIFKPLVIDSKVIVATKIKEKILTK
ncbi:MAG: metallophosphoesterase [Bacilli bacterium]|nr:metallophosphoesterase [Bacilli bacterium]